MGISHEEWHPIAGNRVDLRRLLHVIVFQNQPATILMFDPVSETSTAARLPTADRVQHAGDRLGLWASIACAVHCAAMPVALLLAPALGLRLFAGFDLDQLFVLFATVLGVAMLAMGYRRHRNPSVWWVLLAGLALVWSNAFTPLHAHGSLHAVSMVTGGLLIAWAHWRNTRLSRHVCRPAPAPSVSRSSLA